MINVDEMIKSAMSERNKDLLSVLRLIKAEFSKKETEKGRNGEPLSEAEQMTVLMKMAEQRKDALQQYMSAGREELADGERKELEIINGFLPEEASDEDIAEQTKLAVTVFIATKDEKYIFSMKDMGAIMKLVKEKYPTANGQVISRTVKEILGIKK